jgi:hypothetical protein
MKAFLLAACFEANQFSGFVSVANPVKVSVNN